MKSTGILNRHLLTFSVCALLFLAGRSQAATLTVDGSVTDWGFSLADNNLSTFVPAGGIGLQGLFVEDQDDNAGDGGFVGPNYGGQNYDAEAMAIALQGSRLFITIVSGQRPDNGLQRYGPGDLRILTNANDYGLEIGGGAGGGSGTMLMGGEDGSTYTLNGSGFTTAHTALPGQAAGSIWKNPSWVLDPIPPQVATQLQLGGGCTHIGDADYRFTRNTTTSQHSIIELSIPLSVFGGETIHSIKWHPSCGNDELEIETAFVVVPEPGSLTLGALAAAGLVPLVLHHRRRRPARRSTSA